MRTLKKPDNHMNREGMLKNPNLLILNKQAFLIFNVMLYYHIWFHTQCWEAISEHSSFTSL